MGALGDITSALAPAAQGITAGQLAGQQDVIAQQHYMNALDLQKQQAQLQAKHLELQRRQVEHQQTQDAINSGIGMLKDVQDRLANPANWTTPDAMAERPGMQQLADDLAAGLQNAAKTGDSSGIWAALQHHENYAANNGHLIGVPPAPTGAQPSAGPPTAGAPPTAAPTAPAQAAALPPDVAQILGALAPGIGQLQQAAQAAPAQVGQAMANPPTPLAPVPPAVTQMMAGLLGAALPAPVPAQTAAGPPSPAGVPPSPVAPTPRQDIINNPAAMTPAPAPGPVTTSGYQNLPPGLESSIVASRARTQALMDRLNPDNFVQAGNETASAFQARKDAALDRIDKLQTQQATYEKGLLAPYFDQLKLYNENLQRAAEQSNKMAIAQLQSNTQMGVARIMGGFKAQELANQGARLTEQQQKDALQEGNNAFRNEIVQNRALGMQKAMVLRQEAQQAIQSLPREIQSHFMSGGGGASVGLPDLGLGARGQVQVGQSGSTIGGRTWIITPQVAQYLNDKADFEAFQRQENQYWQPRTYQQLVDSQRDNPAHVAVVQTALNGDPSQVVRSFLKLAATDATKGQAYHLLQLYQQAYPGRDLPPGMDYAALKGIHHPAAPAASAPSVLPPAGQQNYNPNGQTMGPQPPARNPLQQFWDLGPQLKNEFLAGRRQ